MSVTPPKEIDADAEVAQDANDAVDQQGEQGEAGATQEAALYETEVKEQDRWLPIANVARIMKTALPDNAKIAKEAKECMQECVSEFISFITSEAAEKCQHEKRKTVNGEDILFAMTSLGFENYGEALKIYLSRYRESQAATASKHAGESTPTSAAATLSTSTQQHNMQPSLYMPGNTSMTSQFTNDALAEPTSATGSAASAGSASRAHDALQGAINSRPTSHEGPLSAKPFVSGGMQVNHAATALPDGNSVLQGSGLPSDSMLNDDLGPDDMGVVDDMDDAELGVDRADVVDVGDGEVAGSGEY